MVPLEENHKKYAAYEEAAGEHLAEVLGLPKLPGTSIIAERVEAAGEGRRKERAGGVQADDRQGSKSTGYVCRQGTSCSRTSSPDRMGSCGRISTAL